MIQASKTCPLFALVTVSLYHSVPGSLYRGGYWLEREVDGFQSLPFPANEPTPADGVDLDNFRPKMTGLVFFGC